MTEERTMVVSLRTERRQTFLFMSTDFLLYPHIDMALNRNYSLCMTLPNKLTLGRLFLTPFYFVIFHLSIKNVLFPQAGIIIIWIIFLIMEITDVLDGHIARKYKLVSDVGKLMDPFADVIARVTYFICFYSLGIMPLWAMMIIVWREYFIMFIRMLIAKEGTALAASVWGKAKAVTYFVSGILAHFVITLNIFLNDYLFKNELGLVLNILFILAAFSALFSFLSYLRNYMKTETHKRFMKE